MRVTIDTREMLKFSKEIKPSGDIGGAIQWANAKMLNVTAYKTYMETQRRMHRIFTIRNRTIVKAMTNYKTADARKKIDRQSSHVRTKTKNRFTGWVEQEYGMMKDPRKRIYSSGARKGGSNKGVVEPTLRSKKTVLQLKISSWKQMESIGTVGALHYLMFLMRKGEFHGDLIRMDEDDHPKVKKGIYKYSPKSNKLLYVAQNVEHPHVVRKKPPVMDAYRSIISKTDTQMWFDKELKKQIARRAPWLKTGI